MELGKGSVGQEMNHKLAILVKSNNTSLFNGSELRRHIILFGTLAMFFLGAQWLSGRVLDSRPKGSGFESHRRHCVVVLKQDTFILA